MLPERIWIHPDDSLQLYITKAIDGAAPYIRKPEPCVYKHDGKGMYWIQHEDTIRVRPWSTIVDWVVCPYCSGRIVIKENKG